MRVLPDTAALLSDDLTSPSLPLPPPTHSISSCFQHCSALEEAEERQQRQVVGTAASLPEHNAAVWAECAQLERVHLVEVTEVAPHGRLPGATHTLIYREQVR